MGDGSFGLGGGRPGGEAFAAIAAFSPAPDQFSCAACFCRTALLLLPLSPSPDLKNRYRSAPPQAVPYYQPISASLRPSVSRGIRIDISPNFTSAWAVDDFRLHPALEGTLSLGDVGLACRLAAQTALHTGHSGGGRSKRSDTSRGALVPRGVRLEHSVETCWYTSDLAATNDWRSPSRRLTDINGEGGLFTAPGLPQAIALSASVPPADPKPQWNRRRLLLTGCDDVVDAIPGGWRKLSTRGRGHDHR